jgi:hypothetical protein
VKNWVDSDPHFASTEKTQIGNKFIWAIKLVFLWTGLIWVFSSSGKAWGFRDGVSEMGLGWGPFERDGEDRWERERENMEKRGWEEKKTIYRETNQRKKRRRRWSFRKVNKKKEAKSKSERRQERREEKNKK